MCGGPSSSMAQVDTSSGQHAVLHPSSKKQRESANPTGAVASESGSPVKRMKTVSMADSSTMWPNRYVVKGTAGVGKSFFLYIFAWVLLRRGITFLWHIECYKHLIYVISPNKPMQVLHRDNAGDLLRNRNIWYLCNARKPILQGILAQTLMTSRPKVKDDFVDSAYKLWFGPWTLPQLLCANTVSHLQLAEDEIREGCNTLGGVVGPVFRFKDDPQFKIDLDRGISFMKLATLL